MGIYIVRRLGQGVVVLFLSSLFIYTLLMVTPGGAEDQIRLLRQQGTVVSSSYVRTLEKAYQLDRYEADVKDSSGKVVHKKDDLVHPWPTNYLTWLFNMDAR